MSKRQRSNRESKKPAQMTAKAKKTAKRDNKRTKSQVPFIINP